MASNRDIVAAAIGGKRSNSKGFVRVNCPFCIDLKGTDDRGNSLAVSIETGYYKCWRCSTKGFIKGCGTIATTPDKKPEVSLSSICKAFTPLWLPENKQCEWLAPAYEFLYKRKFTDKDIKTARMHGCLVGNYHGRVVVPHLHEDGKMWGFSARAWGSIAEGVPKTLYPLGMDRSILYNEHALYKETDRPCIIVEGCMDATWYLPDVVASLGKPTDAHFEKIICAKRPVVFALDGDAWRTSKALAQRVYLNRRRRKSTPLSGWVRLPSGQDPNSVDPAQLTEAVLAASLR